jgi:hypothetical protein
MYPRWVLSQFLKEDMVGAQTRALIGCTVDELHDTEWTALKELYRQYTRHEIGRSDKDFQNEIEELFADSMQQGQKMRRWQPNTRPLSSLWLMKLL